MCVCDLETSTVRRPRPEFGLWSHRKTAVPKSFHLSYFRNTGGIIRMYIETGESMYGGLGYRT